MPNCELPSSRNWPLNNQSTSSLNDHYNQPDLPSRLLQALADAGLDPRNLQCADLELLDEFHIRGKDATRDLAKLAQLQEHHQVLDLGCGVGGPARMLAQEIGCRVLGMDLVDSYVEAATLLTKLTRLSHLVQFHQGDMQEMPFADSSYDCVWSQHTVMNIADKAALAAEVRRVLRPGGQAVFYEVCAGNGKPVHLPLAWASNPGHSHLCGPEELRDCFLEAGLVQDLWEDVTELSLAWLDASVAQRKTRTGDSPPRPGLGLLMGKDAGLKSKNLGRNLREGRAVVVQGIFRVS